jgi:hypothetical protein
MEEELELARVWMKGEEIQCRLLPDAFEDPLAWGVVLADMASNVASALAEGNEARRRELLESLKVAFLQMLEERDRPPLPPSPPAKPGGEGPK